MATKTKRLRRRGEPTPPKLMSDEEVARAPSYRLEERRREHEAWVERLAARDPGAGKSRAEADVARGEQLTELERHVEAVARLRDAERLRERQEAEDGVTRRIKRAVAVKAAAQDEEVSAFLRELREAALEREREREARRRLGELSDKRRNRPAPEARSVLAAVMSDAAVYELLTRRSRESSVTTEFGNQITAVSAEPILELEDVAVLAVVLHLLSEQNPITIGTNYGGTWPPWSDLPPTRGLLGRVRHLARNAWLELKDDGSGGVGVTYGERSIEVARQAGVTA